MGYYNRGMIAVGADPGWGVGDYRKRAKLIFDALPDVKFLVVQLAANGGFTQSDHYDTKGEMATAYDASTNHPGKYQYIAMFDRTDPALNLATLDTPGLLDDSFFTAYTTETKERSRVGLGWILGGVAALGLAMATKARH